MVVHLLAKDKNDNLYLSTYPYGLFVSKDDGVTWDSLSNLPTVLCLGINSKGYIFAGSYGVGMFRSIDD